MTAAPDAAAGWCAEVAAALLAASERVARLSVQVGEDWLDDRGREWAERAALLHRELDRAAARAAELGARQDDPVPAIPMPIVPLGPRRGPRLGGTGGVRADDGTGMRIAELPPA